MGLEVALVLLVLAGGLVFFALDLLPIEATAVLMLGVLLVGGVVGVSDALSGFSNPAVVTIASLFVLSQALASTGLIGTLAERLAGLAGDRPWGAVAALLGAVSLLSGFLNNTAVMAIFLPLLLDLCNRLRLSPSRVLIPLSYAAVLGGTLTLIGTSTNLLVSSIAVAAGEPSVGMFELAPMGLVFLVLGLAYTLAVGRRLLPERVPPGDPAAAYGLGDYLSEVRVDSGSSLVGRSVRDAGLGKRFGIQVLGVLRAKARLPEPVEHIPLRGGDVLVVQASVGQLVRGARALGLSLLPEVKLSPGELTADGLTMVELLVAPRSGLVGRTLKEADFRGRFGGFVMALRRHSETLRDKVAQAVLEPWDALLTLIPQDRLSTLRRSRELVVLTELPIRLKRQRYWWLGLLVLPVVVGLAAAGVLEIAAGALLGAAVLLAFRVLTPREAYDAVHWQVVVLIAALVPVGQATLDTGTADLMAAGILRAADFLPLARPLAVLALLYLGASLLTEVVSNAAAAIVLAPIALSLAEGLGVDPRPFLMAVCFAASAAFMTPIGYQTNLMVYAPGGYRFLDYTRFGAPLNLLFWLVATLLIPRFWSF